jgi:DNA-binding beta-propeller fold protein YncE
MLTRHASIQPDRWSGRSGQPALPARPISRRGVLAAGVALSLRGIAGAAGRPAPARPVTPRGVAATAQAAPREPAPATRLDQPQSVAFGPNGSIFIADTNHHRVRRLDPDGFVTTVAGSGIQDYSGDGDLAIYAGLRRCSGLALDAAGGLYIADSGNHCVRYVAPDGRIVTVAGTGQAGDGGDGGPAWQAQLRHPVGLALGPDGTLYLADSGNNRVRQLRPDGLLVTVAGTGPRPPAAEPVGGTRAGLDDDDVPATAVELVWPWDVAVGPDGTLYIADLFNHCVRRVDPAGRLVTVAGSPGLPGRAGDGEPARQPALAAPRGLTLDPTGGLIIADTENQRVCQVGPDGRLVSLAGSGVVGFDGDGGPARAARLHDPWGVVIAPDGALIIANRRVRRVDPAGRIATIAGGGPTDREAGDAPPAGPATE